MPAELARLIRRAPVPAPRAPRRPYVAAHSAAHPRRWGQMAQQRVDVQAIEQAIRYVLHSYAEPVSPVSTITSHVGPARQFQRFTCSTVLSVGRARAVVASAISASRTPWRTESERPSGKAPSARTSSHVVRKSRHPASANRSSTGHAQGRNRPDRRTTGGPAALRVKPAPIGNERSAIERKAKGCSAGHPARDKARRAISRVPCRWFPGGTAQLRQARPRRRPPYTRARRRDRPSAPRYTG